MGNYNTWMNLPKDVKDELYKILMLKRAKLGPERGELLKTEDIIIKMVRDPNIKRIVMKDDNDE